MYRFRFLLLSVILCSTYTIAELSALHSRPSLEETYLTTGRNNDTLRTIIYDVLKESNFPLTLEYATELYDLGKKYHDDKHIAYAAAVIGMCHVNLRQSDSAYYYLREAINVGEAIHYDWGLTSAYNGMGLYLLNFGSVDYYQSIEFFTRGIEAAKRADYPQAYSALLSNIAWVYYLRKDSAGLPYALQAYEHALEKDDPHLIFMGAHIVAAMHYIKGDYSLALQYIKEAENAIQPDAPDQDITPFKAVLVYTLYGDILMRLGNDNRALEFYDKALTYRDFFASDELAPTYISYGDYYKEKGRINEAMAMYFEGLDLLREAECTVSLDHFYKKISECYELLGNPTEALHYHREYVAFQENAYNIDKERSLNEMRVKYDLEKMEVEIENNKLVMLQQKRRMLIMWLCVAIVILIFAGTIFFYRRREKFYLQIVRQSQAAIKARQELQYERSRETPMPQNLTSDNSFSDENKKYAFSPLSSQRGAELFARLEQIMAKDKLYRDKNLNIDRLAEALAINRSYLSRIINEHSGQNFNNYVNKYRINEAMEILSDTENNTPLKALSDDLGFKTLATFYNSFQKEAGLPPSKYRKKVMELSSN